MRFKNTQNDRDQDAVMTAFGFRYAAPRGEGISLARTLSGGEVPEAFEIHVCDFFFHRIHTFVDIGANTGLYCCRAAQLMPAESRIAAFEPQQDCIDDLKRTIEANNWKGRIACHAVALGDRDGSMELHVSGRNATFIKEISLNPPDRAARVPVRTLDGERDRLKLAPIDMIKIDVDGVELALLHGAVETVSSDQPILFVEIIESLRGGYFTNPHYSATVRWLLDAGYLIFRCTDDYRLERILAPGNAGHVSMYLCLHADRHAALVPELLNWARAFRQRNLLASLVKPFLERHAVAARRIALLLPPPLRALARRLVSRPR